MGVAGTGVDVGIAVGSCVTVGSGVGDGSSVDVGNGGAVDVGTGSDVAVGVASGSDVQEITNAIVATANSWTATRTRYRNLLIDISRFMRETLIINKPSDILVVVKKQSNKDSNQQVS